MAKKTTTKTTPKQKSTSSKIVDLALHTEEGTNQFLTTNHGTRVNNNQDTLKAGERGPSLLEDFIMREKIMHFDHERIPERIVHARGAGAHGVFELYKSMSDYTRADFLQQTGTVTPVFVRFSTVAGSRGSSDLARDVRGFSVKFYTQEGNYDLVGNNIPVFFIQDAMKFPDLIHSVKPEPHNEIPQAASAHDTFWDFVSLMPESMHMIMWAMSDRAIPRSLRMMEGFGVHTFRFVNAGGKSCFVKFHWKPLLGLHSVAWDEAQKISGKDPDFHRRDLWEAIEKGNFPEWELGVQIVEEKDEHKFDFDLLDPTKLIPEELVPVQIIGKMTLNRNPDNFFAETEQVAFHPGHVVPGIDFSNDPLLQGRLFSYSDTQLSRLGSPNFHEIPINRPVVPVHNNQRDGHMRQMINKGQSSYDPNTTGGGCPFQAMMAEGGFSSHTERVDGRKVRARSRSFFDHFSQATLFYNSQSNTEKRHLTNALRFELSKVQNPAIRERVVSLLTQVDKQLASKVADALGIKPTPPQMPINHSFGADADMKKNQPVRKKQAIDISPALSMVNSKKNTIQTRCVAVLLADGVNDDSLTRMKTTLESQGAQVKLIGPKLGAVISDKGKAYNMDESFLIATSVVYDAIYLPGGSKMKSILKNEPAVSAFINEAWTHCKPLAVEGEGAEIFFSTEEGRKQKDNTIPALQGLGLFVDRLPKEFVKGIAQHRFWNREEQ